MNSPSPVLWTSSSLFPSLLNTCVYPPMSAPPKSLLEEWVFPSPLPITAPQPPYPINILNSTKLKTETSLSCVYTDQQNNPHFSVTTTSSWTYIKDTRTDDTDIKTDDTGEEESQGFCKINLIGTNLPQIHCGDKEATSRGLLFPLTLGGMRYDPILPPPIPCN